MGHARRAFGLTGDSDSDSELAAGDRAALHGARRRGRYGARLNTAPAGQIGLRATIAQLLAPHQRRNITVPCIWPGIEMAYFFDGLTGGEAPRVRRALPGLALVRYGAGGVYVPNRGGTSTRPRTSPSRSLR